MLEQLAQLSQLAQTSLQQYLVAVHPATIRRTPHTPQVKALGTDSSSSTLS
jgi:hypothetical protein